MAASTNNNDFVIFKRGDVVDDDIWDDTALIKAYDEAVSGIKAKISPGNPVLKETSTAQSKPIQNKKKKKNVRNKKKYKWKVGDMCTAIFSEDGLPYQCEILTINLADETCFVRYTNYGNEEQQNLADILPPRNLRNQFMSDMESEAEWHGDGQYSQKRPNMRSGNSPSQSKKDDTTSYPHRAGHHSQQRQADYGSMLPPPPMCFPGFPSNFWSSSHSSPVPTFPMVPPIPPPPLPYVNDANDASDTDSDSLCSMLMSWYMSGYHTGYYQGLKDARKRRTQYPYYHK